MHYQSLSLHIQNNYSLLIITYINHKNTILKLLLQLPKETDNNRPGPRAMYSQEKAQPRSYINRPEAIICNGDPIFREPLNRKNASLAIFY